LFLGADALSQVGNHTHLMFYAMRDIQPGEQLRYDYGGLYGSGEEMHDEYAQRPWVGERLPS